MAKSDGSVIIDTRMNTSGFHTGVANIRRGFDGLGSAIGKLGKVMAGVFAVKQLIQFGKEAVALGSDLSEVQNVVDVTFENLSGEINEFASNAIEQFGLSETAAKQYTSTMGAMLKSMGFTTRQAADMSMTMTGLAADMASFYNLNAEDAFYKIRAGISGETEPLKQLGINLNVANLEQYALAQGITKSYNAMTQQEQALLRYNYLLSVTADAQGDFARTSDSWANQTRILSERFKALKATIGQGLINVFLPVVKVINGLLAKLATLANAFKSFTELITGKKSSGQTSASGAGISGGGLGDMEDGYDSAADSAENYAGAVEDAADATKSATKEAEKYLSGLDEIKRFEEPDTGAGNGTGTDLASAAASAVGNVDYGNLAEGETVLEKTSGIFDKIIQKVKELGGLFKRGFFDGLGDYEPTLNKMRKDFASIKDALKDIFTSPDVTKSANNLTKTLAYSLGQIAGSLASIGISIASNLVGGISKYLIENKNRIISYIASMFDITSQIATIFGNFSEACAYIFSAITGEPATQITADILSIFSDAFITVTETCAKFARDILDLITKPFIDNKDTIKDAVEGTLSAISSLTSGIKNSVKKVADEVKKLYDAHLKPFFDSFSSGVSKIVGILVDGYNQYIAPVLQRLGQKFKEVMEGPVNRAIEKAGTVLGKFSDLVKQLWESILQPFLSWIASAIMPALAPVIEFIGNVVLQKIKTVANLISDLFDVLGGLIDFISGVFKGDWKKAWNGIVEIFRGIWNGIKDIVKTPVNFVIGFINKLMTGVASAVNAVANMFNSMKIDIPDWVPVIGGGTLGFNLPTWTITPIPYLAQGAVIPPNAPFAAVLGDQKRGNNIETPEALLRKIVREETGGQSINGNIELKVYLSGQQIYQEVMRIADIVRAKSGRSPYEVV